MNGDRVYPFSNTYNRRFNKMKGKSTYLYSILVTLDDLTNYKNTSDIYKIESAFNKFNVQELDIMSKLLNIINEQTEKK